MADGGSWKADGGRRKIETGGGQCKADDGRRMVEGLEARRRMVESGLMIEAGRRMVQGG